MSPPTSRTIGPMEKTLGIGPLPITINEYSGAADLTVEGQPGASASLIAKFERLGVESACISFWDVRPPGATGEPPGDEHRAEPRLVVLQVVRRHGRQHGLDDAAQPRRTARRWTASPTWTPPRPERQCSVRGGPTTGFVQVVIKGLSAGATFGAMAHVVVEHTPFVNRTTVVKATNVALDRGRGRRQRPDHRLGLRHQQQRRLSRHADTDWWRRGGSGAGGDYPAAAREAARLVGLPAGGIGGGKGGAGGSGQQSGAGGATATGGSGIAGGSQRQGRWRRLRDGRHRRTDWDRRDVGRHRRRQWDRRRLWRDGRGRGRGPGQWRYLRAAHGNGRRLGWLLLRRQRFVADRTLAEDRRHAASGDGPSVVQGRQGAKTSRRHAAIFEVKMR